MNQVRPVLRRALALKVAGLYWMLVIHPLTDEQLVSLYDLALAAQGDLDMLINDLGKAMPYA